VALLCVECLQESDTDEISSFVICDAGGGTVDLISYTITKLKPILEVEEAAPGTGGICGSTFLNQRFASFLERKLGNQENFDDEVLAEAMEKFERVVSIDCMSHHVVSQGFRPLTMLTFVRYRSNVSSASTRLRTKCTIFLWEA